MDSSRVRARDTRASFFGGWTPSDTTPLDTAARRRPVPPVQRAAGRRGYRGMRRREALHSFGTDIGLARTASETVHANAALARWALDLRGALGEDRHRLLQRHRHHYWVSANLRTRQDGVCGQILTDTLPLG